MHTHKLLEISMPSLETKLVDDKRIVDSNDDTNVSEDDGDELATFLRKERQRREDEKVYIDLTNEETVKSMYYNISYSSGRVKG